MPSSIDEAAQEFRQLIADAGTRAVPEDQLHATCQRLRTGFAEGDWRYDLLAACTGVDPRALPEDDQELWLTLAAGVVRPEADAAHTAADDEAYADWHALRPADWLGAVSELLRGGPGTPAEAEALGEYAAGSRRAHEMRGHAISSDVLAPRFRSVDVLWRALEAIDRDALLTPLGHWGIPEALLRAWPQP